MPTATARFEAIFAAHSAFAWRALARFGVQERDLPDLCQEVFVIVLNGLDAFEGRSSLKSWIYGICRRVASNHRRRAASTREALPGTVPDQPGDERDAFDEFAHKEARQLLDALLARLPADQREVFLLYEVEELSMREVAEALDCRQNTAYSRLYAAREALAGALKQLRARRVA